MLVEGVEGSGLSQSFLVGLVIFLLELTLDTFGSLANGVHDASDRVDYYAEDTLDPSTEESPDALFLSPLQWFGD